MRVSYVMDCLSKAVIPCSECKFDDEGRPIEHCDGCKNTIAQVVIALLARNKQEQSQNAARPQGEESGRTLVFCTRCNKAHAVERDEKPCKNSEWFFCDSMQKWPVEDVENDPGEQD